MKLFYNRSFEKQILFAHHELKVCFSEIEVTLMARFDVEVFELRMSKAQDANEEVLYEVIKKRIERFL